MRICTKIKTFFKKLFNTQPNVTNVEILRKVEILKRAKSFKSNGLCYAIDKALLYYGIDVTDRIMHKLFPSFKRKNAIKFGADAKSVYWWPPSVWHTGREDFLDWLIKRYENDKTDVRKFVTFMRIDNEE